MRQTVRFLNDFGITPTNNHISAGSDFYIPYFDEDKKDIVFTALKRSYGISDYDIENVINGLDFYGKLFFEAELFTKKNIYNIVHLFFALHSSAKESYTSNETMKQVEMFVNKYLTFDSEGRPGLIMDLHDYILINSGIHVALNPGTAGVFLNKSGKGNAGFDVRAQVVDEDYTGYVHLSLSYTKDTDKIRQREVYCGDKITQMVVLPVINCDWLEVGKDEYNEIMYGSERGANSFGSSDEKH